MTSIGSILKQTARPICDDDRFSLTPAGYAALNEEAALAASKQTAPKGCPRCGCTLAAINLYHGGRGYVAYDSCTGCDYRRRAY